MYENVTREALADIDPDIMFADGYDDCLLGMTFRGKEVVALYSTALILLKLSQDMSYEEAVEFFEFNILGAYVGEKTPVYFDEESVWNQEDIEGDEP